MAERDALSEEAKQDQTQCEVFPSLPLPSHIENQGNTDGIVTKTSKYLPNGKIRLPIEDNGLVTHSSRIHAQDDGTVHLENVSSNCQCDKSPEGLEASSCHTPFPSNTSKSLNCKLSELASEFDSLDIDSESKEQESDKSETSRDVFSGIEYVVYKSEVQMPDIMRLITKDLSEPYSIYTYRYFIHNWPRLCFLVSILYVL